MAGASDYERADWSLVPAHLGPGLKRYIDQGIRPGGFLVALITNNLSDAVAKADDVSIAALKPLVNFLHWYAPTGCHGSPLEMSLWIEGGGLAGPCRPAGSPDDRRPGEGEGAR